MTEPADPSPDLRRLRSEPRNALEEIQLLEERLSFAQQIIVDLRAPLEATGKRVHQVSVGGADGGAAGGTQARNPR